MFVSSTYVDLKEHRQRVITQLRKAGYQVDPMEDWTSDADEPTRFSLDRLYGCQACVLLIGFRRGFVPMGQERSITQMEYHHAIERGIDVLPFLLDGKVTGWPDQYDDRTKDPQLNAWREYIGLRHGVEWFGEHQKPGGDSAVRGRMNLSIGMPQMGGHPMKIKVQLVVCAEDGREEEVHEVAMVEKPYQRIEHLGFTLAEAKSILKTLQQYLVKRQATAFVAAHAQCDHCGNALGIKGYHTRTFRTLFGTMTLTSPRLYHCRCQRRKTTTFRPLNALLTDSVAPELLFMETTWASLVSYGLTAQALKDFLPVDATLNATTVQNHTLTVAQRCEDELGEELWAFVEGCPADWEALPIPDGPITVGIDGGYVRNWEEKQQHFEVIVGKSILAFRRDDEEDIASSKCFGFVQTLDEKPKRRLFEVLKSQGHQMNQQLTLLSDGGDTVRDLQLYLNPHAEHLLDWFHLAMRLTILQQIAKGLPQTISIEDETYRLRDAMVRELERLKWFLWHGNTYRAFQGVESVEMDLDVAVATGEGTARKLLKAVQEFHTYIDRNRAFIPNYGERYRYGERISTGFVESTVNQVISKRFCKQQQMQWTKRGAHLLLQTRVKALNHELGAVFHRWYPDLQLEGEPQAA